MTKVYLVYQRYHEHDNDITNVENEDGVMKVFTTEDKAIDYICERIKSDHESIDTECPDDKHFTKHKLNRLSIRESVPVESWERHGDNIYQSVFYRYESYNLE